MEAELWGSMAQVGVQVVQGRKEEDAVPQIQDHLPHTHILMQGNTLNTPGDNNLFYKKVIHLIMFKEKVVLTGPVSLLSFLPPSTHFPSPAGAYILTSITTLVPCTSVPLTLHQVMSLTSCLRV